MNEPMQFLADHGGLLLFAVVFLEQAGLPLPAMPWLLAAGAVSARGDLNLLGALGVIVLACVLADSIWFFLGRHRGKAVLNFLLPLNLAKESCVLRPRLFSRGMACKRLRRRNSCRAWAPSWPRWPECFG